jgi:uncharacterized protein YqjF (DUF2071 family)
LGAFLTAEWRNLVMVNFAVEPEVLLPLVPVGTKLDYWNGTTFVSLVGFLFRNTRVLGIPVPGHITFEEVNLRFYVRRETGEETRRGVTFIRELVPRTAIALTARALYNEAYEAVDMRHQYGEARDDGVPDRVEYSWKNKRGWTSIACTPAGSGTSASPESQEEFITEHYWGYTRQRDGGTIEYQVTHPRWRVWNVDRPLITGDPEPTYGSSFAAIIRQPPSSAFLADGSQVTVFTPTRIT